MTEKTMKGTIFGSIAASVVVGLVPAITFSVLYQKNNKLRKEAVNENKALKKEITNKQKEIEKIQKELKNKKDEIAKLPKDEISSKDKETIAKLTKDLKDAQKELDQKNEQLKNLLKSINDLLPKFEKTKVLNKKFNPPNVDWTGAYTYGRLSTTPEVFIATKNGTFRHDSDKKGLEKLDDWDIAGSLIGGFIHVDEDSNATFFGSKKGLFVEYQKKVSQIASGDFTGTNMLSYIEADTNLNTVGLYRDGKLFRMTKSNSKFELTDKIIASGLPTNVKGIRSFTDKTGLDNLYFYSDKGITMVGYDRTTTKKIVQKQISTRNVQSMEELMIDGKSNIYIVYKDGIGIIEGNKQHGLNSITVQNMNPKRIIEHNLKGDLTGAKINVIFSKGKKYLVLLTKDGMKVIYDKELYKVFCNTDGTISSTDFTNQTMINDGSETWIGNSKEMMKLELIPPSINWVQHAKNIYM
ncbi:MAG: hypothetical protein HRT98_00065 [Mycoplasmatales bacterium]|nr:hypothetical protein [Mycoplasmatales bacterium]